MLPFLGMLFVSLCLWPIFLVILLLNEIARLFLSLSFLIFSDGLQLLPDGQDSSLREKSNLTSRFYVVGLYSLDPVCLDQDLLAWGRVFKEGGQYSKLKRVLTSKFGYGCSQDIGNAFDLKKHVRLYDYFSPKDGPVSENEVCRRYLPPLFQSLDESRPQWEWLLIPQVLRGDGKLYSLRLIRMDHGFMDGISLSLLLKSFLSSNGDKVRYIIDPLDPSVGGIPLVASFFAYLLLPFFLALHAFTSPQNKRSGALLAVNEAYAKDSMIFSRTFQATRLRKPEGVGVHSFLGSMLRKSIFQVEKIACLDKLTPCINITRGVIPRSQSEARNEVTFSFLLPPREERGMKWEEEVVLPAPGILAYLKVAGRFPGPILRRLCNPGDQTVNLNNLPFTKDPLCLGGTEISHMGVWSMLYRPSGLGIQIISYAGAVTVCGYAVKCTMTEETLEELVAAFVSNINNYSENNN